ncbi:hypothetical protein [Massilia sp. CF038]|uniref:hypothetical protein n=1 Tax=Massilia sp. CF038 TaxID=1881045 RepID=UPI000916B69C|nr:hypothetical protein [Massilia sp. CF038]SHH05896.1 hypothetical protein SAMN05428948_2558 [Massilia sp. CF038]
MIHIETVEQLTPFLGFDLEAYEDRPACDHPGVRISQVFTRVARAIREGDRAAAAVGIAVILKDPHLPFGRLIKSDLARALKQHPELLDSGEVERFLFKTAKLLSLEYSPREVQCYAKLVRKLGPEAARLVIGHAQPIAERSRQILESLRQFVATETSGIK